MQIQQGTVSVLVQFVSNLANPVDAPNFLLVRDVLSFPNGKDDVFRSALQKDALNSLQLSAVPQFACAEAPGKDSGV